MLKTPKKRLEILYKNNIVHVLGVSELELGDSANLNHQATVYDVLRKRVPSDTTTVLLILGCLCTVLSQSSHNSFDTVIL